MGEVVELASPGLAETIALVRDTALVVATAERVERECHARWLESSQAVDAAREAHTEANQRLYAAITAGDAA